MAPLNQTGNSMHIAPSNLRINPSCVLYQYVRIVTVIYYTIGIIWRTIASTRFESIYVWYSVMKQVLNLVPGPGRSAGSAGWPSSTKFGYSLMGYCAFANKWGVVFRSISNPTFLEDENIFQKSARVVPILPQFLEPRVPIFEKCSLSPEKKGGADAFPGFVWWIVWAESPIQV